MHKKILIISFFVFWAAPALAEMIVDTAWVRRYNGLGNWYDKARSIAVDESGNIYVTGSSVGSAPNTDYVTIKYCPNGDTAWVRRYDGSGNGNDHAYAIAIDDSANVFVTGSSVGSGTDYDYATIKYSANGDTAWARRYNGPGNGSDGGGHIALDGSGNIYVFGGSHGSGTSGDYATIKYYPNGDTAWVRRYNGPDNGSDGAGGMVVDSFGNVYVTGRSYGNETADDYTTIKYHPNGDTVWVRRYTGPGKRDDVPFGISIDDSGNVYVTGESVGAGTGYDYLTIKYYSNGDTAWVRRYHEENSNFDKARSIAIDDFKNVYVTGYSIGVGAGTGYDYVTIKYRPDGDTAWLRRCNAGGNSQDFAVSIVVDDSANVYVTGYGGGVSGTYEDYVTISYYPNGDTGWVRRYNGLGSYTDWAQAIAVDDSANIYVTGGSYGSGTNFDYATLKYFQALRGDANRDGMIDITDVVCLIYYLFIGGPPPAPLKAGDANCDGEVDIADAVYLVNYLFIGGPPPEC